MSKRKKLHHLIDIHISSERTFIALNKTPTRIGISMKMFISIRFNSHGTYTYLSSHILLPLFFTASVVLQWSWLPSIYNRVWKNLFIRWTGSATAKNNIVEWQQTKSNQTYAVATNPHECAVSCINLMSSKFKRSKQSFLVGFFSLFALLHSYFYYVLILFDEPTTIERASEQTNESMSMVSTFG